MSEAMKSNIEVDDHWGLVPEGEAARLLGAGDPSVIEIGSQPDTPDHDTD